MDREELIFQEYKLYAEQKENFIDRNFRTNRFYMISFVAIIFALIFTNNVVFMEKLTATLIFQILFHLMFLFLKAVLKYIRACPYFQLIIV